MTNPKEPRKPLGFVTAEGTVRIPISPSAVFFSANHISKKSDIVTPSSTFVPVTSPLLSTSYFPCNWLTTV